MSDCETLVTSAESFQEEPGEAACQPVQRVYASTEMEFGQEVDSGTELSEENSLNTARLQEFKERYSNRLLSLIREEGYESGFHSQADTFVRQRIAENALATKDWLSELFVKNFRDDSAAAGLLRVIGHLDYEEIGAQGLTMAMTGLGHRSAEVRESAVAALENWASVDSLNLLKTVNFGEKWLNRYVSMVIADLEGILLNAHAG